MTDEEFTRLIWNIRTRGYSVRQCDLCKHMTDIQFEHCTKFEHPTGDLNWKEQAEQCKKFKLGDNSWLTALLTPNTTLLSPDSPDGLLEITHQLL